MGDEFVRNDLRITCAEAVELVTEYLDDALAAADLDDFETHLGLCEGCRVYLDQIRRTVRLISETGSASVEVQPANFDQLLEELGNQGQEES